jgi:DNA-binding transcriptional LysR family regulator
MVSVVRRRADFGDLRLFWAVAEAGSFGGAARALGVSTSTLTRAVDTLETRLQAKLLARSTHGVSLTPAGVIAYDKVLTMERAAAALEAELLGADKAVAGRVKLAAPDGVAGVFLTPYVSEFLRANPDIELVIDCGLWPDRPLDGEVDLALTFTEPTQSDAVAKPIAHFHYGLFGAQAYFDLYGEPTSLAEALTHPYVHHTAQVHQRSQRAAAFQLMSEKRLQTNSSAVSVLAIKEGAGIGPLPTAILPLQPTLKMIDLPAMGPVTLWLTHQRASGQAARVRRVIEWLEDVFDPSDQPWFREEYVPPSAFAPELERRRLHLQGGGATAAQDSVTQPSARRRAGG